MSRSDYAFPFRLGGASRSGALAGSYAQHVADMIRQVLLTAPGERVNLPTFGCGLRRLLFAPNSDALATSAKVLVRQALDQWLAGQIEVQAVEVLQSEDDGQLSIQVDYTLLETRSAERIEVVVR